MEDIIDNYIGNIAKSVVDGVNKMINESDKNYILVFSKTKDDLGNQQMFVGLDNKPSKAFIKGLEAEHDMNYLTMCSRKEMINKGER